jgi:hypothetical protein
METSMCVLESGMTLCKPPARTVVNHPSLHKTSRWPGYKFNPTLTATNSMHLGRTSYNLTNLPDFDVIPIEIKAIVGREEGRDPQSEAQVQGESRIHTDL